MNDLFTFLTQLMTEHAGLFESMGNHMFRGFAVILICWYGVKSALASAGGVISLGSLVGFLTVLGIAARNGIMMVNHFQHLERYEGEAFGLQLVLRGAFNRVLLGLLLGLPLAVGAGRLIAAQLYGVSIWDPLALSAAAISLAICAFFAAIIPAGRAASISPMSALRTE